MNTELTDRLNALRLAAFKSNSATDKEAYHQALSMSFQNGELIAASPQPANPAQVTDAQMQAAHDAYDNAGLHTNSHVKRLRAALSAAIGAGGQAVRRCCSAVSPCSWQRHNGMDDVCPTCTAAALSQPHPADDAETDRIQALEAERDRLREGCRIYAASLRGQFSSRYEVAEGLEVLAALQKEPQP